MNAHDAPTILMSNRSIVCRFLPPKPRPSGEAATRAAAIAEGAVDNGDDAVQQARRSGIIAAA